MQDYGGYIWFIGLGGATLLLALLFVYGRVKGRPRSGNPNQAWEQAARETGHPETARPQGSDRAG